MAAYQHATKTDTCWLKVKNRQDDRTRSTSSAARGLNIRSGNLGVNGSAREPSEAAAAPTAPDSAPCRPQ